MTWCHYWIWQREWWTQPAANCPFCFGLRVGIYLQLILLSVAIVISLAGCATTVPESPDAHSWYPGVNNYTILAIAVLFAVLIYLLALAISDLRELQNRVGILEQELKVWGPRHQRNMNREIVTAPRTIQII